MGDMADWVNDFRSEGERDVRYGEIPLEGSPVKETDEAWLVNIDVDLPLQWFPKSQAFLEKYDNDYSLMVPEWLLVKMELDSYAEFY